MKSKLLKSVAFFSLLMAIVFSAFTIGATQTRNSGRETLTLEKCLSLAITRNPYLKSSYYAVKSKHKELHGAWADLYSPSVELGTTYSYVKQSPASSTVAPHTLSTSLSINKVLYSFGRLGSQVSVSEKELEVAKLDMLKARSDLIKNVRVAFYNLLLAKENLKVMYESHKVLKDTANYQNRNYQSGKIPKFEYLRIKIQYENNKVNLTAAKESFILAINQLYTLLNIKPVAKLKDIKHKFAGNFKLDLKPGSLDPKNLTIKEAIHRGKHQRVEIKKLYAQKRILEHSKTIARSGYLPVISGFFNAQYDYTQSVTYPSFTLGDFSGTWTFSMGVKASVSLSNLINPYSKAHSQESSLKYQIKASGFTLENTVNNIEQEIIKNYRALREAEKNISRRKSVKKMAEENFEIAKKRYKAGAIDYLNYRDVEVQAQEAKLSYNKELFIYNSAYLNLLEAMGEYYH